MNHARHDAATSKAPRPFLRNGFLCHKTASTSDAICPSPSGRVWAKGMHWACHETDLFVRKKASYTSPRRAPRCGSGESPHPSRNIDCTAGNGLPFNRRNLNPAGLARFHNVCDLATELEPERHPAGRAAIQLA